MPSEQHHVIGSQRIEIRLAWKDQARDVQERLSRLAHGQMFRETEAVFSEVCPPTLTYRLDRLVVDLGVVPLDRLEEEILARFAPRLRQELSDLLHPGLAQKSPDAERPEPKPADSLVELLEHLLKHGTLPWWAGAHAAESLEEIFLQAADDDAAATELLIRQLGHWPEVRQRLIRQLSPAALERLVRLLEPAEAALILEYADGVQQLHEESAVAPVSAREFHEAKWELILRTMLAERGSRFNAKAFLQRNVEGLSQRFGMAYRDLLRLLAEPAAEPRSAGLPPTIMTLLRELDAEVEATGPVPSHAASPPVTSDGFGPHLAATDPDLLAEEIIRYFRTGGGERRSLTDGWRFQPKRWQAALWERVLLCGAAADLAPKIVALFPPEDSDAVHRTLPRPFEIEALRALGAGLASLNRSSISGPAMAAWWRKVFELALRSGGDRCLAGDALRALLQAGLPAAASRREAIVQLLNLPTIRRHPRLRRALALQASDPAVPEIALTLAALQEDPRPALALFARWLRGEPLPSSVWAALRGGPEALLIRLELFHRAATINFLRELAGNATDLRNLTTRSTPALQRRILFLLAPRAAPILSAGLAAIRRRQPSLFGYVIGARELASTCWQALVVALSTAGAEFTARAAIAAIQAHLGEIARQRGFPSSLLDDRLRAIAGAFPTFETAALAQRPPLADEPRSPAEPSREAVADDLHIRLERWRALLHPSAGPRPSPAALASLWAAGERDDRLPYRRLLLAAAPDWSVVDQIIAVGGEAFLLSAATLEPASWRAELSAWLDLIERTDKAKSFSFDPREWRGRALQELVRLARETGLSAAPPRAVVLKLIQRLGLRTADLEEWDRTLPANIAGSNPHPDAADEDLGARLKLWRALLASHTRPKDGASALAALWAATEQDPPFLYRELLEEATPAWSVVARIIAAGGEAFFLWAASAEHASWRTELSAWLDLIGRIGSSVGFLPFDVREWRARALRELFLLFRETGTQALPPGAVLIELLLRLGVHAHALRHWATLAPSFRGQAPPLARLRALPAIQGLAALLLAWIADGPPIAPPRLAAFIRRAAASSGAARRVPARSVSPVPPTAKPPALPKRRSTTAVGDPFFVDNAGLVILSPFFARYHEANHLLEDGRFRDEAAAERGVHLLQSLLADERPAPEQFLTLNKVLCGLLPETPIVRAIEHTTRELELARTLLSSAIQNWPKASNLTIDGFRGSFLWRRGKLTRGEDRWTLTVEQRGYDVLFSSLPWSFSVIKPRWMPEPLYVEWV